MFFDYKKKIKDLEKTIENLHGHLEERGRVNRERQNKINELTEELNKIKTLISEDVLSKIKVENTAGIPLIEAMRRRYLSEEEALNYQKESNDSGWYTLLQQMDNSNEYEVFLLFDEKNI